MVASTGLNLVLVSLLIQLFIKICKIFLQLVHIRKEILWRPLELVLVDQRLVFLFVSGDNYLYVALFGKKLQI